MNSHSTTLADAASADFSTLMKDISGPMPFLTPEAGAFIVGTLMKGLTMIQQSIEGAPGIKQEWGTCTDIGKIYGKTRGTISTLLRPLAAEGKVRVCTTKDSATGAYGGTMYNLADVQRCFMENAREAAKLTKAS